MAEVGDVIKVMGLDCRVVNVEDRYGVPMLRVWRLCDDEQFWAADPDERVDAADVNWPDIMYESEYGCSPRVRSPDIWEEY